MADDFTQFALELDRGDTAYLDFTCTVLGAPADITGYQFRFTGKRRLSDSDAQAALLKTTGGGGIEITNAVAGLLTVFLAPGDFSSLSSVRETLLCDLQGVSPAGDVFTMEKGTLLIRSDVSLTVP